MKPVTKYKIIETFIKKINVKEGTQARKQSIRFYDILPWHLQYPACLCHITILMLIALFNSISLSNSMPFHH